MIAGTVLLFIIIAAIVSLSLWVAHIRQLRADMDSLLDNARMYIEQDECSLAQADAEAVLELAERLRDDEAVGEAGNIIRFTGTVLRSNELFDDGNYQEAMEGYLLAAQQVSDIEGLSAGFLVDKISQTQMYITFYDLIEDAEALTDASDYPAALSVYEDATAIAYALSFHDGVVMAAAGIEDVQERIIIAKRVEASGLFFQGEQLFFNGSYTDAIIYYKNALQIYIELGDKEDIRITGSRIEASERKLAEIAFNEQSDDDDTLDSALEGDISNDDTSDDDSSDDNQLHEEPVSNYEFNLGIYFDMTTLIDNQNRRPANQVRMGANEGFNEGWYNGCGWVATYNALILLGNPVHPAEIVRYFEASGGTVLGGIFGTYPNTIEAYLKGLGFNVNHTLFPQLSGGIDDAVKASRVCILAYAHTSAAHYIAVEYREDIDKFVVYNDSLAGNRSSSLGFQNETSVGAAIDSVTEFILSTPDILFLFSFIAVGQVT